MKQKSKPKTPQLKPYIYRGFFRCGECGCFITTETQKGHNYVKCTKRKVKCSQKYTREDNVSMQIQEILKQVSLSDKWAQFCLFELEKEKGENRKINNSFVQNLKSNIFEINIKLEKLLDLHLEEGISKTEYAGKKGKLILEKKGLEEKLPHFEQKSYDRFEPLIQFIKDSNQAKNIAVLENPDQGRDFLKKIGSNFRIQGRVINLDIRKSFALAQKYGPDSRRAGYDNRLENENSKIDPYPI